MDMTSGGSPAPPIDTPSWRRRYFRRAGEGGRRRRTSDWIAVSIALALVIAATRHVGNTTATEKAVFELFNTLPNGLAPLFRTLYRLGALWAVGLVVVAALVIRRLTLARDLLLAGLLAWAISRAVGQLVVEHESLIRSVRSATRLGSSPSFPAVRIAVIVAIITVASPYVRRPTRIFGWLLVGGLATASLYLGNAVPVGLFAGVALGWGVGSGVHLIFGSPGMRPTIPEVVAALAQLGIVARNARLSERQPSGSTVVHAEDDHGPLRVKVVGRDEAQSRLLTKLWSLLVYRDSGPRLSLTRTQQVEHEAFLMLVAKQAGVTVPEIVAAGRAGPRAAVLVERPVVGEVLADADPATVDDAVLNRIWENVAALQRARIAHNDLDTGHVIMAGREPHIVGFDEATSTGKAEALAKDVATMLATTSALVGPERAVRAAIGVMGSPCIEAALPLLQPAALAAAPLSGARRREVVAGLGRLREVGAAAVGIGTPELTRIYRIGRRSAAMALGALVAIAVLLSELGGTGEVWATLRSAQWEWLALALGYAFVSNVGYAIGLQGTVPIRLPLWRTTEVQLGMSFSNLAIPAIGGQAMQVRYLQKVGVDLSAAVAASGVLGAVGALIASAILFVLALALDPQRVDLSLIPTDGFLATLVLVGVVAALVSAVLAALPRLRRIVIPPITRAAGTIWDALRSPQHLGLLVLGNAAALLLATWCLQACLVAVGGHTSFWALLAANIAVVAIANSVPVPGGSTAVGTVGLSAALVSFGVDRDVAVAAALANQLAFYYLPAIPGWFATRDLARHDYL